LGLEQDYWLAQLGGSSRFKRWVVSKFAQHLGPTVLEVGCGTGNFTELLAEFGRRVTGVDINAAYVEQARQRLESLPNVQVRCADATSAEWTETFDSVVLLDVLEHIEADTDFLGRLQQALKPSGRLILKVPAGPWLYGPMDQAIGHHRRYDRPSLGEAIRTAGMVPVSMRYFNLPGTLGWWLNGRVFKRSTPPSEQIKLFEYLVPLFRASEFLVPPPFGLSLIAVCKRAPEAGTAE
jgi:SAM-dependent methyltransferase